MAPLTGPQRAGRIGDGAHQLTTDVNGVTLCVDPCTYEQVHAAAELPGVNVWESHRGEMWMRVPYNAASLVGALLGRPLPSLWDGRNAAPPLQNPTELYARLRPHQRAAFELFVSAQCGGRLMLGDAMGLGKTATAIACLSSRPGPHLVIGPKMLRATWRAELAKWAPGEAFHAVETANPSANHTAQLPAPAEARWIYIHYDIVYMWWSWLRMYRFTGVIVDEAHTVSNMRTKRGEGVALAVGSIDARVILTGTPIENRTAELHNLLQLLTGRGTWGGKGAFRVRYCGARLNVHGGLDDGKPTNVGELRVRLDQHYLRRTPSQVSIGLPPVQRIPRVVPMDEKAHASLERVLNDPAAHHAMVLFAQTGKLPSAEDHQAIKAIGKLRKAVSTLKVPATTATVIEHLQAHAADPRGGQAVVFTWTREMAATLEKAITRDVERAGLQALVGTVTGADSQKRRDANIDLFRAEAARGTSSVVIATYGALGVGVNMQYANAVVEHDLDWTPAVMLQAEARVWRGGQDRHVSSYWMIGENTFDEYIIRLLLNKAQEIAAAIGDEEPLALQEAFAAFVDVDPFADYAKRLTAWQENRI